MSSSKADNAAARRLLSRVAREDRPRLLRSTGLGLAAAICGIAQAWFIATLLATLRNRELRAVGEQLASETGMPFNRAESGEYVSGTYRQRLALASGRSRQPGPVGNVA